MLLEDNKKKWKVKMVQQINAFLQAEFTHTHTHTFPQSFCIWRIHKSSVSFSQWTLMEVDLNQGFKDGPGLRCFLGYLAKTEDVERHGSVSNHFHLLLPSFGLPHSGPTPGPIFVPNRIRPSRSSPWSERQAGNKGCFVSLVRPGETWVRKWVVL